MPRDNLYDFVRSMRVQHEGEIGSLLEYVDGSTGSSAPTPRWRRRSSWRGSRVIQRGVSSRVRLHHHGVHSVQHPHPVHYLSLIVMSRNILSTPHTAFACILLSALVLNGCVQTQATMFDTTRHAPVPEEQVRIYLSTEAIGCAYEEVALIHAQGDVPFTNEHKMLVAARQRAGDVGANGLVLGYIDEPSALAKVAGSLLWHVPDRRGEMLGVYVYDPCSPREPENDSPSASKPAYRRE